MRRRQSEPRRGGGRVTSEPRLSRESAGSAIRKRNASAPRLVLQQNGLGFTRPASTVFRMPGPGEPIFSVEMKKSNERTRSSECRECIKEAMQSKDLKELQDAYKKCFNNKQKEICFVEIREIKPLQTMIMRFHNAKLEEAIEKDDKTALQKAITNAESDDTIAEFLGEDIPPIMLARPPKLTEAKLLLESIHKKEIRAEAQKEPESLPDFSKKIESPETSPTGANEEHVEESEEEKGEPAAEGKDKAEHVKENLEKSPSTLVGTNSQTDEIFDGIKKLREHLATKFGGYQAAFNALDTNGSGTLSLSEVKESCKRLQIDLAEVTGVKDFIKIFKVLESGGDGGLSIQELFFNEPGEAKERPAFTNARAVLQRDNSRLSISSRASAEVKPSADDVVEGIRKFRECLATKFGGYQLAFNALDTNGNGTLSLSEVTESCKRLQIDVAEVTEIKDFIKIFRALETGGDHGLSIQELFFNEVKGGQTDGQTEEKSGHGAPQEPPKSSKKVSVLGEDEAPSSPLSPKAEKRESRSKKKSTEEAVVVGPAKSTPVDSTSLSVAESKETSTPAPSEIAPAPAEPPNNSKTKQVEAAPPEALQAKSTNLEEMKAKLAAAKAQTPRKSKAPGNLEEARARVAAAKARADAAKAKALPSPREPAQ